MRKKGLNKDIIVLLVSTLITIASWVGFEIYRAYIQIKIPENVEESLKEIDPVIERAFFDKLKSETGYEE